MQIAVIFALWTLVAISGARVDAKPELYRAAIVDERGNLRLIEANGTTVAVSKRPNQVTFEQPRVSDDHRTIGWLEADHDPGSDAFATPVADRLIVYRAGRIVRIVSTPQIFWSWRFADHDQKIVACTGPTHGGASNCTTRNIATGIVTARWSLGPQGDHT